MATLPRYRPAVLAVTGVAAAAGIYALYTISTRHSSRSALHRSNAVHRHRPRQTRSRSSRLKIEVTKPDLQHPAGTMTISQGSDSVTFVILLEALPSESDLRRVFGSLSDDFYREVLEAAVYQVLLMTLSWEVLRRYGNVSLPDLQPLCEATNERSEEGVRASSHLISHVLIGVTLDAIDAGVDRFLQGPEWTADFHPLSVDGQVAETENMGADPAPPHQPSPGLKGLLYHIAEEDAKRKAYEHRGICCEGCSENPIKGVRYHCLNCPDYDLCSTCEAQTIHNRTHVFAKIKIPMPLLSQPLGRQPPWYPGDETKTKRVGNLAAGVRKHISETYGFEEPNVEAFFDQFMCIANVVSKNADNSIRVSINRQAFTQAFTPDRWPHRFAPSPLLDRMFAFYDVDSDGLIGFAEFVSGISYLRGPKRLATLQRVVQGFDFDNDGFVDRADFVRLLRSKFDVHKQLVKDMVLAQEADHTHGVMETLLSSQPISAVFNQEEVPRGEGRVRYGKQIDAYGDVQPMPNAPVLLPDDAPWRRQTPASVRTQLSRYLSRFEEMLHSGEEAGNNNQAQCAVLTALPQGQDNGSQYEETVEDFAVHDQLWAIEEEGLHTLLDKLFGEKEQECRDVITTRSERRTWKQEIASAALNKSAAEEVEPSTAIGDIVSSESQQQQQQQQSLSEHSVAENQSTVPSPPRATTALVPTDEQSLNEREEWIARRSLAELLEESGYGTLDADAEKPEQPDRDPTMPQFKPDVERQAKCPSPRRLAWLAKLEAAEVEMTVRGGPGRLSLDEVSTAATKDTNNDTTEEIQGLIMSWLMWASF